MHISHSTVGSYIEPAAEAVLTWTDAEPLKEAEVETVHVRWPWRAQGSLRHRLRHWVPSALPRTGVTVQLLWAEYQLAARAVGVVPYQYSQFCELYAGWRNQRRLSMRQTHRLVERLFIG